MATNRHTRRAEAKRIEEAAKLPNLSGDDRCCGNCRFSMPREVIDASYVAQVHKAMKEKVQPPGPTAVDDTYCLKTPSALSKKVWGFCHEHEPPQGQDAEAS